MEHFQTGTRFGKLVVIEFAGTRFISGHWRGVYAVRCDCGKQLEASRSDLKSGLKKSCSIPCSRNWTWGKRAKHFAEYVAWRAMHRRCYDDGQENYKRYGGRGIKVCERWHKFDAFFADMGNKPTPKHTLERIDVNGHYEPDNCEWATRLRQARNKRNNRLLTLDGVTKCVKEWSELLGVTHATITQRLEYGWPLRRALTEPPNPNRQRAALAVAKRKRLAKQ